MVVLPFPVTERIVEKDPLSSEGSTQYTHAHTLTHIHMYLLLMQQWSTRTTLPKNWRDGLSTRLSTHT